MASLYLLLLNYELVANVNVGENKLDSYIAKMTDDNKYIQVIYKNEGREEGRNLQRKMRGKGWETQKSKLKNIAEITIKL